MEVRVALDTSRLTDLFQGDTGLSERLSTCDEVWIPLVVLAEIKAGFYGGTQQHRNEILLRKLLAKATVGVLLPSRLSATPGCLFSSSAPGRRFPTTISGSPL